MILRSVAGLAAAGSTWAAVAARLPGWRRGREGSRACSAGPGPSGTSPAPVSRIGLPLARHNRVRPGPWRLRDDAGAGPDARSRPAGPRFPPGGTRAARPGPGPSGPAAATGAASSGARPAGAATAAPASAPGLWPAYAAELAATAFHPGSGLLTP